MSTNKFKEPQSVDKLQLVFGGDMEKLLPAWKDIPEEFKFGHTRWNKLVSEWFFSGLSAGTSFIKKEGIDPEKAISHVASIMRSWAPKHEHKEAGCAYLLSLWFEDIITDSNIPEPKP